MDSTAGLGAPEPNGGVPGVPLDDFRVVGIGASAGGLEALERLLREVPVDSGLAFVIVEHLDPTKDDMLAELLQRSTTLVVTQAADGERVLPGHAYVIPPGKDIGLTDGALWLVTSKGRSGHRLPIDTLFASLAAEYGPRSRAVVLSGMGADGTLGLRAVRGTGGVTFAQEPSDAKFDAMPCSAIDAGVVDVVARAEELPAHILASFEAGSSERVLEGDATLPAHEFASIIESLRDATGRDFSLYKPNTLRRRIERRMGIHGLGSASEYVTFLRDSPWEYDLLKQELLIGVTEFFRDPEAWSVLGTTVLPELLAAQPRGATLRAWVPACSTGEEAYSLAILFNEVAARLGNEGRCRLQVFATDIDSDAIDRARRGIFSKAAIESLPAERVATAFVREGDDYRVRRDIREMLIFSNQDILSHPPFTKLQLLLCRNLLIYLSAEPQARLIRLFHFALDRGGVLMLGKSETVGPSSSLFAPYAEAPCIYRRADSPKALLDFRFPPNFGRAPREVGERSEVPQSAQTDLQQLTEARLLQTYAPAAVLVNADGDILYVSGRIGRYLEPAAGRANLNVHAMARDGLRLALAGALRKAAVQETPLLLEGVRMRGELGVFEIDLTVEAMRTEESGTGNLLVVFSEKRRFAEPVAPRALGEASSHDLDADLPMSPDEQRLLRAETQSVYEAFQAANEELQSANEELQSANEELTASKEEMQSLNEELQTVNAELQSKLEDLSVVHTDMANLLDSTELAIVFLDGELRVRRFTPFATRLFRLLPHDVGRPLSDVATELDYPAMHTDIRSVLATSVYKESSVSASGARWFELRIFPYRTAEGVVDGVVLTFADVTRAKALEAKLRGARTSDAGTA